MTGSFSRLFRPKSIAIVGGGAWSLSVIEQLKKSDYRGAVWPVHPSKKEILGHPSFQSIKDLPDIPDAAFIGINRTATIDVIRDLSALGAGGAICFASGFSETSDGANVNTDLLEAAGSMPILGPNCYGLINALDGVPIWPDQHGCTPVQSGVAILTQSSNIAINLTMQRRGLPIGYVVTCGNQAQLSMAQIGEALLDDPRVTAIGLHIEGFKELRSWQSFARKAQQKGMPVIALKVGRSNQASAAAVSHTASLAGSDAGAQALLNHLGIARVHDLPTFLETLKLLHCGGPLTSTMVASVSCSGGEASLIADLAEETCLTFPPLSKTQCKALSQALGPKVSLANPLDYHTYIWRDTQAMTKAFSAIVEPKIGLTFVIVDFPRRDTCDPADWECAIQATINAKALTAGRIAMVATLPELMPEDIAMRLMEGGVIPLNGLCEALAATEAAQITSAMPQDIVLPTPQRPSQVLTEAQSKDSLKPFGATLPQSAIGSLDAMCDHADANAGPFVLKATGLAHKSEHGGVALNLSCGQDVKSAGDAMSAETFLIEDMICDPVAELIVGVVKDPAHGFVLTLGAGGIFAELLNDTASLLLPTTRSAIRQALSRLKVAKVLSGYRNGPTVDFDMIADAVLAVQAYCLANLASIQEVEVNPLIVTPSQAVVADALIRKAHD